MARSTRWSIANGLDYVMNHGWEKRDFVRDDVDHHAWMRLLDRVAVVRTRRGVLFELVRREDLASGLRLWVGPGGNRRVRVPRSRSLRRGRANEAETWIVDGAITATSTVIPQSV